MKTQFFDTRSLGYLASDLEEKNREIAFNVHSDTDPTPEVLRAFFIGLSNGISLLERAIEDGAEDLHVMLERVDLDHCEVNLPALKKLIQELE